MKGLNERLANYTGQGRDQVSNYDKLAEKYGKAVEERKALEASWEDEDLTSETRLAVLKEMIAEELSRQSDETCLDLPVISNFEAYQIAKKANLDTDERDAGIRRLTAMLKKKWSSDRMGDLVGASIVELKKHFFNNYPKSRVAEVFDIIAESGYLDMDLTSLARIAEDIHDQDSFEYEVRRAGIDGNSEKNKKARKILISMVTNRQAADEPDFITEPKDLTSEEEEDDFLSEDEPESEPLSEINFDRSDENGRHPKYQHLVMAEFEPHHGMYIVTFPSNYGDLLVSEEDAVHMIGKRMLDEYGFGYVSDEYLSLLDGEEEESEDKE